MGDQEKPMESFRAIYILIQGEKVHTLMKSQIAAPSEGKRRKIKRGLGRRSEVRTVLWLCSPPSNKFLNCRAASFLQVLVVIEAKLLCCSIEVHSWDKELHAEQWQRHK
jgi:hypothetical protein